MLADIVTIAAGCIAALVAGGLAVVSAGIARAGVHLDEHTWPVLHRALDRTISPYMRALALLAFASALTSAVVSGATAAGFAFAAAAAVFAVVLAISVRVNVPINREVAAWTTPPPPAWRSTRARWNTYQHVRTAVAITGWLATSTGVLLAQ